MPETKIPSFDDIHAAHLRIKEYVHRTPVLTNQYLNELCSASLYFKCENFQKTGSFKARGACNAVFSLQEPQTQQGVITHSSGNHGAALAFAAQQLGISATVVMPRTALESKKSAVKYYGATLVECDPTSTAREQTCDQIINDTNASFVHPYNDLQVITGQATCAKELLDDVGDLNCVISPIGGGGLTSGTALSLSTVTPAIDLFAAAPSNADDAARSMSAGHIITDDAPNTIADGLKMPLKELTWHFVSKHVQQIYTVSELDIVAAMKLIWQRMKIVVEPSSAIALAAVLNNPDTFESKNVGIILSGGNVNLDALPWMD